MATTSYPPNINCADTASWQLLLQLLSPFAQALPNTIDDVALIKLANEQGVLFALKEQLEKKQALTIFEPLTQDYFAELYCKQCQRQQKVRQQIAAITACLNDKGITPLYFKGAAFLLAGWHKTDASRFFIDIDILLSEQDAAKAQNILQQEGYQPTTTQPDKHHHLPSLLHKDFPLSVEIHTQPLPARAGFELAGENMLRNSAAHVCENIGSYKLASADDCFAVVLGNAEVANAGAKTGAINLKDALDVLALLEYVDVASKDEACQAYVYAVLRLFNAPEQWWARLAMAEGGTGVAVVSPGLAEAV